MKHQDSGLTTYDIQARVRDALCAMGYVEQKDFFLSETDSGTQYVLLQLTWTDMISESLLLACSAAHGKEWGVLIAAFDDEKDDIVLMVEACGGGFSYIAGGDAVLEAVEKAYQSALRASSSEG
jgi:hypothetical protein